MADAMECQCALAPEMKSGYLGSKELNRAVLVKVVSGE